MKKLLTLSLALLSVTTLVACSGHKVEQTVPEEKSNRSKPSSMKSCLKKLDSCLLKMKSS